MNPIKPTRKHWTHAALPLVVIATFAGIVVLITLFASHGPVTSSGSSSSYGARGNELIAQSTFHTGDLIVDNTSKYGGKMQIGAIAPGASQQAWFSLQSASTTTQLWIQEDDTGHTGSGGNNESINQVYRNFTGFAMGSGGTATASAIDIHVNASKTSGSGTLETLAILSTAEGGDDNFDYLSLGGTMKHVAGPALFAGVSTANLTTGGTLADLSASTAIKLNQNITSTKNAIPGDSSNTPQLAIGLTATADDGTGLQIKNKNGAQGLSGIDLLADTAVNGNQSTGVFMTRGNGGGGGAAGNNPAGIALIGNVGSIISNGSVGDMAVYNQVAGGRVIFGADAVHADYQMALDQTGKLTIGVTSTALNPVLSLVTGATASTIPLNFSSAVTNTWDISPLTGSNTDPATVTVFANTPTTTPSVDSTLNMHLIAGTGGAGGVNLSPNGVSYMDPDHWAFDHTILAIGFLGGSASVGEVEIHDQGNIHTGEHPELKLVASSTYNTGSTAVETTGIQAVCGATHGTGSGLLTNTCALFDATLADVNNALVTGAGDVILNRTNGNTTIQHGTTTIASTGSAFVAQVHADFTSNSTYTAAFGNVGGIGQVYILNGTIDAGWSEPGVEHLDVNFFGQNGGTGGATRDFNIRDGNANIIASFTGASKTTALGGLLNMNSHRINNLTDPSAAQDAATKAYVDAHSGSGHTGSGTANTIVKWTAAGAQGDSSMVDDGTGISTPEQIQVNGGATIQANGNITGVQTMVSNLVVGGAGNFSTYLGGNGAIGQLGFSYFTAGPATGYINNVGNSGTTSDLRSLEIDDGEGSGGTASAHYIAFFDGATRTASFNNVVLGDTAADTISFVGSAATPLNMNSHQIHNVTDPTSAQDAATQAYVLAHAGTGNVTSSTLTANTIPKATSASAIGNSLLTDNATTLSYGGGTFAVTASNGNINTSGAITATSFIEGVQGVYSGGASDVFIHNGNLGYAFSTNGVATGYINAVGFSESTTQFRNLEVDDGKGSGVGHAVLSIVGSIHAAVFSGTVDVGSAFSANSAVFTTSMNAGTTGSFGSDLDVGGALEVDGSGGVSVTGGPLSVLSNLTAGGNTTLGSNAGTTVLTVLGRISLFGENTGDLYTNDASFNCAYNTNASATCKLNAQGYLSGTTQFRSTEVDDGKAGSLALFDGPNSRVSITGTGGLAVTGVTALGDHLRTTGTAITTGDLSCGVSPAVATGSTDTAGTITLGAVSTTSCRLNFKTAYASPPFCVCSSNAVVSGGAYVGCGTTTGSIVAAFAAGTAAQKWSYVCVGP